MISLDFFPGLPYCQWGKGWIGDFLQYTIFTLGFQPPLKHNQNNGWKNITTIVYLRVLIIQIGSTIILMVVEAQGLCLKIHQVRNHPIHVTFSHPFCRDVAVDLFLFPKKVRYSIRWWFSNIFLCSPRSLGKCSNLKSIFLKWVGEKPPTRINC